MVLGKKVAIFNWEWGRNSAPRDGLKLGISWGAQSSHMLEKNLNLDGFLEKSIKLNLP